MTDNIVDKESMEEDKKPIQLLSLNPKGIKKKHIVQKPIIVRGIKGDIVTGLLQGYGEKSVVISPLNRMKNYVFDREKLAQQNLKLYVNPLDEEDVVIVSQSLIEDMHAHASLPYKERKKPSAQEE